LLFNQILIIVPCLLLVKLEKYQEILFFVI
jgi:hypothetical protein